MPFFCTDVDQPMAVWKKHTMNISKQEEDRMENALRLIADEKLGEGKYYVDKKQRSIATHLHWHARAGKDPWKKWNALVKKKCKL